MTIERPMFPPRAEVETIDPFSVPDAFCDALVHIERLGPCRRLVFSVADGSIPDHPVRVVIAKLVLPAESLAMIAARLLQDVPAVAALDAAVAARPRSSAH